MGIDEKNLKQILAFNWYWDHEMHRIERSSTFEILKSEGMVII